MKTKLKSALAVLALTLTGASCTAYVDPTVDTPTTTTTTTRAVDGPFGATTVTEETTRTTGY